MGVFDFLKSKKTEDKMWKKELEVPAAPPTAEELPEFPSPKDIPEEMEGNIDVQQPLTESLDRFEQRAVESQEEVLGGREDLTLQKPIFVTLTSYKDMVDEIGLMNNILKESEDTVVRVGEFKEDEDKEFNKWESEIRDIQKKLIYVDKALFGKK